MKLTVGGSFARGLVLTTSPTSPKGEQRFELTPEQSKTLLLVLEAKWKTEQERTDR